MYIFEYDPNKSQINFDKHGIDFEEAKLLWNDPDLVEIPVNTSDEPRFVIIALHYRTPLSHSVMASIGQRL